MTNGLYFDYKYLNDDVPEEEKLNKEYLISNINKHISDLFVEQKNFERKCFNFAFGIRDAEEMSYLTDNYGVSNPVDVPFVPITRKRINYLVNKALQNNMDYQVTCQNRYALEYKLQRKKYEILNELSNIIQLQAQANAKLLQKGKQTTDLPIEEIMKDLKSKYNDSWKSDIEVAAYHYIQYFIDKYDLKLKFNHATENLIIAGQPYYRAYIKELGKDPIFEIVHPEELFVDPNNKEEWIKNHKRVVRVKLMTATDIINELGHYMTKEEKEEIEKIFNYGTSVYNQNKMPHLVDLTNSNIIGYNDQSYSPNNELIRVFHVEWLANNPVDYDTDSMNLLDSNFNNVRKVRHRKDRYEGYKIDIGRGIYIGCGKTKYVNRSLTDPFNCELSYNGFRYRFRNGEPYSIVWKSRDIQNMYDLTWFQLSSLFASIIPGGPVIPEEAIPKSYGNTPEERQLKDLAYRKLGYGIKISLSQEGYEALAGFNHWGANVPSNVDANLIQALQAQLEILEQQLDNLMGITRQSLGEMEERDGKGTTMMAVTQAEIVNKDLYFFNSMFIKQALTSIVNLARIAHKEGFIGSYSLGLEHKIFTIDPETFTIADYNIFFSDEQEDMEKLNLANDMIIKALESQMIDLRKGFDALMQKSTTYKKRIIDAAGYEQEKNNAQNVQQLQMQLEELQKQLEILQKENAKLKEFKTNTEEIQLKREELEHKKYIDIRKLNLEETKRADMKELKNKEIQVQVLEMSDDSPYNDKFREVV